MRTKWVSLSLSLVLIMFAFFAVQRMSVSGERESVVRVEDAIRKAAVTCYAIEGSYPPLDYLVEHYGVVLYKERFYYHYEMVAGNIMPVVRVIPRWR